jgi:hypothetical protein
LLLRTSTSIAKLQEKHVRLLTRRAVTNLPEVIGTYSFGLYWRAGIRKGEVGSTIPP